MINIIKKKRMKQNKLSLLLTAATMLTLVACSSDEVERTSTPQGEKAISLTSSVAMTRAESNLQSSTLVSTSVKVGAFGVSGSDVIDRNNNIQYAVDANGVLNASNRAMIWPQTGSASIYAYAPYAEGWTYNEAHEFTVKTDQSTGANYLASDLLYGVPAKNPVKETTEAIPVKFVHKLAKLTVTITKASNSAITLNGGKLSVLNTKIATTFTPNTGAITAASGTATVIKAGTLNSETPSALSVIIVPQQLAAGTRFLMVEAGGKTYVANLPAATTFEGGKAYELSATVSDSSAPAGEALTISSTTITDWDSTPGTTALGKMGDVVVYGVGDYLLADGTLVKAANIGTQTPAAIIFSTTVSATDAAAGYGAYAMALKRYKNRTFHADADHTAKMATGAGTWSEGLNDLDGRTNTATMLASDYYAARSADEKTVSVINLSGYTPALSGATNSGWFLPSFGQMIQIINTFGEAAISGTTVEDGDNIGSGSAFYTSADGALTTLVTKMQTNVTKADADLFAVGSIVYATSTENNSTSSAHLQKFWSIQCASAGTYAFGKNTQRGTNNSRSVIPVTAVKLPTE